MPLVPFQHFPEDPAALYKTTYINYSPTPTEFAHAILTAVDALNELTTKSIRAWDAVIPVSSDAGILIGTSPGFPQSLRDIAFKTIEKGDAFARIQVEHEFDEKVRMREQQIFAFGRTLASILESFKEVDDFSGVCKKASKALEHYFAIAKDCRIPEKLDLGGCFVLHVGLGGDAPLPQPRFQHGSQGTVSGMTLANARILKKEIDCRVEIVHAHYVRGLIDIPALSRTALMQHRDTMKKAGHLREYIRTRSLNILDPVFGEIDREDREKPRVLTGPERMAQVINDPSTKSAFLWFIGKYDFEDRSAANVPDYDSDDAEL